MCVRFAEGMLDARSMSAATFGLSASRKDHQATVNGIDPVRPPDNLTDEELMAQLATGDEAALTPLHDRYAGLVLGMVAHSLDRPVAEEITQDVFVTIWRKADSFDPRRGYVRPWLLQIAQTRMLNEVRRQKRRPQRMPDPEGTVLGAVPDSAPLPEEVVWCRDCRAAVMAAINRLPPNQRQALSLACFEELTQEQVAERLGLPLGTAKTRIRAGKRRLRATLRPLVVAEPVAPDRTAGFA